MHLYHVYVTFYISNANSKNKIDLNISTLIILLDKCVFTKGVKLDHLITKKVKQNAFIVLSIN